MIKVHAMLPCCMFKEFIYAGPNSTLHYRLSVAPLSHGTLVSPLLALAKVAIYKTRVRRLADGVSCDCGAYFQSSVRSHFRAEFLWAASTDSLDAFEEQWALSGVLCSVSPSGSLRLTL
ncbi:unnamed protein product [Lepidochelys kempii]